MDEISQVLIEASVHRSVFSKRFTSRANLCFEIVEHPTFEQVVRQLAQLPQVVVEPFRSHRILPVVERLQRNHTIRLTVGRSVDDAAEMLELFDGVLERLRPSASPRAEEVVRHHRVDVLPVALVGQVPLARHADELAVVPVEDDRAVRLALDDVAGELVLEAGDEQRWDTTQRRQPVLENVVEDDVVEREEVFEFTIAQTVLEIVRKGKRAECLSPYSSTRTTDENYWLKVNTKWMKTKPAKEKLR